MRLHNSDCPLAIQQNSKHMYCICSTQVSAHAKHALRETGKHPRSRPGSSRDDVLTVTQVKGWENQVVGVVRVERVLPG